MVDGNVRKTDFSVIVFLKLLKFCREKVWRIRGVKVRILMDERLS